MKEGLDGTGFAFELLGSDDATTFLWREYEPLPSLRPFRSSTLDAGEWIKIPESIEMMVNHCDIIKETETVVNFLSI